MDATDDTSTAERAHVVHERFGCSRVGRRWERIALSHRLEIEALATVHPDLAEDVGHALWLLAAAARRAGERLDDGTVAAVARVLDHLDRLGTFELRRDAQSMRDELQDVRGHTLAELLVG